MLPSSIPFLSRHLHNKVINNISIHSPFFTGELDNEWQLLLLLLFHFIMTEAIT